MVHLLSYRPGVISNGTAFEAMASIYKYLQKNYGYEFTIVKSKADNYDDPSFKVISISSCDWKNQLSYLPLVTLLDQSSEVEALLNKIDGVLTVDPTAYSQGLFAIKKSNYLKKPVWFDTSKTNLRAVKTLDWRLKRKFLVKESIKCCTGIIATVPKCLERFQDLGLLDESVASKFYIMGHPVDMNQFKSCERLSKSDHILRVLVVSRMVPEKGLLYILEAMTPILENNPQVQLQLLGSGILKPLIEQQVYERGLNNQVVFLNPVPHKELALILKQADVFVSHALSTASWEEYFGAANLEAMACELPCVLTSSGGISYAVRENDAAIFVDERNIIQLREAVIHLLGNEQKRIEIGRKARGYVERHYSLPVIAQRYHQMLQKGLSQNSNLFGKTQKQ